MSPVLLQAVTTMPLDVAAICGPLMCEAASLGRTAITEGDEKEVPLSDE